MNYNFESMTPGLTAPASDGVAVTPSDQDDLDFATRALYVGGTGDLAVQLISGNNITLRGLQGGNLYPLRVARVLATGTTATDIVGLR
ncbi:MULTISPECIES: hypothetical protein [Rhodobacterales]|uniref:spike base protein, RCAP_Rcc01079 family n=1 Tax=Rhodobacterales TaxID=204455 RepID=UPI00329A3C48